MAGLLNRSKSSLCDHGGAQSIKVKLVDPNIDILNHLAENLPKAEALIAEIEIIAKVGASSTSRSRVSATGPHGMVNRALEPRPTLPEVQVVELLRKQWEAGFRELGLPESASLLAPTGTGREVKGQQSKSSRRHSEHSPMKG